MSKTERNHWAFQFGTDAQFLKWISTQPSVIDDSFNQYEPDLNIPCHYRSIKYGAGTGHKPKYRAVAMTDAQHQTQTKYGEAICLNIFHPSKRYWTPEEAAQWFEEQAEDNERKWRETL